MKIALANQPQIPEIVEQEHQVKIVEAKVFELEKDLGEVATPRQIKKWVVALCEAEDIRRTSAGEEYRTPSWDARVKGLDRVMSILHYTSKEPKVTVNQPSKIVIQVIGGNGEK